MRPLVSILITAYNAEPWIGETLDSALGQTYSEIEVLVVDDGSTDRTLHVARSYDDPRLSVLSQPNAGACAARNRAIAASEGQLVQFLDADDLLSPGKIERQVERLADAPSATVASGPWVRFREAPPPPDARPHRPDWRDYDPASDWLVEAWTHGGMFASFAWPTPRALVERAGP